jgi:addiction module HigA family antidote
MTLTNQYKPDIVFHPATTLKEKLEEMGMSNKEFALRTGKPEKTIIAVLKEQSSFTPEMAVLFENVTQIPAQFWINKQARFNEYVTRKKREAASAKEFY